MSMMVSPAVMAKQQQKRGQIVPFPGNPNAHTNTGIVPPTRQTGGVQGQYDPNRGVPAGGQSLAGGSAQQAPVPMRTARPEVGNLPATSAAPLPQRPTNTPAASTAGNVEPIIRPIEQIKPHHKAPKAWVTAYPYAKGGAPSPNDPGVMTATGAPVNGAQTAGKGGKNKPGKGGVSAGANQNGPVAPLDPNAKLPTAAGGNAGGVSGGTNSQGGGVSGGATGGGTPQPAGPSINDGRVDLLNTLLGNPQSMSPEVQAAIVGQIRDTRDMRAQDNQRRLRETYAGRGMGDSGVLEQLLFNEDLAASSDIANAERGVFVDAARTNFNDMQNVVNLALNNQLGMGNLGLANAQFENGIFNQDRQFQTQLAQMMMDMGLAGQNQQSNLMGQFNALLSSGLSYRDALSQLIFGQAQGRYADPGVSAVGQYSYAPNPYLDYMAGQNAQDSGGDTDWFNMAMQAASTGAMFL